MEDLLLAHDAPGIPVSEGGLPPSERSARAQEACSELR